MSMTLSYASPLIDAVVKSHSTNPATRSGVSTSIHMCRSVSVDDVGVFSSHLLCSPQTETHVHHSSLRWTGIHNAPEAMSLQHRPFLVAGDRPPHTGYSCIVQVIILLYSPLNTNWGEKVAVAVLFLEIQASTCLCFSSFSGRKDHVPLDLKSPDCHLLESLSISAGPGLLVKTQDQSYLRGAAMKTAL